MKKLFTFIITFFACAITMNAQVRAYKHDAIRCLGVGQDGSQTLCITNYAKKKDEAKEQALKDAVWVVLFEGVKQGSGGCNKRPIISDIRAYENHESYFNVFFTSTEGYVLYAKAISKPKLIRKVNGRKRNGCEYETTVRVACTNLKYRMKGDNIIP